MIPVNLKMHNFMPYKGDAPALCFAPIHTACISGDNGAGKSSIIDAITWALWGESRAKSDDDLIHQGQNETSVQFDFSSGGQLYRVVRKHARPKGKRVSGQSSLDLFSCLDDAFIPISGDNKTQTQLKINKDILHMDYATFTNSAYLRQGHADEFTRQPAGKRKEVLASILGLEIYDIYEESARAKAKEAEQMKLQLSAAIGELESDLGRRAGYEAEIEHTAPLADEMDKRAAESEASLKQLRKDVQALEAVSAQVAQLDASIQRHAGDLKRESERLSQSRMRLETYRDIVAQRARVESDYEAFQNARRLADELSRQAVALSKLKDRKNRYEKIIDQAQAELNTQHGVMLSHIQQFESKTAALPALKSEQQQLGPARQALEKLDAERRAKLEQSLQKKSELSRLSAGIAGLKTEIASIDGKLQVLGGHEHGARCPVCETELGAEKLEVVQGRYAAEKKQKLQQIKQHEAESARLAAEVRDWDAEIAQMEQTLKKDNQALAAREGRISQSLSEASEAASSLLEEKARLTETEEALSSHRYALPEQLALSAVNAEIAAVPFDEKKLEAAQAEIARLKASEEQKRLLDEALKLTAQEEESAARAEKAVAEVKARILADSTSRESLAKQLKTLPELSARLERAETDFRQKSEEHKALRERLAVLRAELKRLDELEKRGAEKRKDRDAAAGDESLYKELARIFGKKGIQAMLIETALPEIEEEANRLLSRMTDGRMSLAFETQGLTKKGEVSETLDIKIADELGTRDYEMFSGGEAFRIDFSVRIALSRLLARRAGAPLPTLIIDEGFGTQDQDGIEKLKEAINSVQDDFQKILVITHIDELKDAFPTRIDVLKTADGSTIQVS